PWPLLLDRLLDVVAHQVELVKAGLRLVDGVYAQFSWRQSEDQPTAACVDRFEPQHVAQERTHRVRVVIEDDRMRSGNHSSASVRHSLPGSAFRADTLGSSACPFNLAPLLCPHPYPPSAGYQRDEK